MAADNLSPARLRELLAYDQDTGEFSWRVNRGGGARAGDAAGHLSSSGYVVIKFGFTAKKAHRLAWLYQYGVWPNGELDHIDGNKTNNAIRNLRDVGHSTNCHNVKAPLKSSIHGMPKGVSMLKRCDSKPYRARISVSGKMLHLGVFATREDAHAAYCRAKYTLLPFESNGARVLFDFMKADCR